MTLGHQDHLFGAKSLICSSLQSPLGQGSGLNLFPLPPQPPICMLDPNPPPRMSECNCIWRWGFKWGN